MKPLIIANLFALLLCREEIFAQTTGAYLGISQQLLGGYGHQSYEYEGSSMVPNSMLLRNGVVGGYMFTEHLGISTGVHYCTTHLEAGYNGERVIEVEQDMQTVEALLAGRWWASSEKGRSPEFWAELGTYLAFPTGARLAMNTYQAYSSVPPPPHNRNNKGDLRSPWLRPMAAIGIQARMGSRVRFNLGNEFSRGVGSPYKKPGAYLATNILYFGTRVSFFFLFNPPSETGSRRF